MFDTTVINGTMCSYKWYCNSSKGCSKNKYGTCPIRTAYSLQKHDLNIQIDIPSQVYL